MVNDGEHGCITVASTGATQVDGGNSANPRRDGGLLADFQGLGRTTAAARSYRVFVIDTRGSYSSNDGWWRSRAVWSDMPVNEGDTATFHNGHVPWGPGSMIYLSDLDIWIGATERTGSAATGGDGGYEAFCTNKNGQCGPGTYAGTPTAGDCNSAGQFGKTAIDTSGRRFCWCEGAAGWRCATSGAP